VIHVDTARKLVRTAEGAEHRYDVLISTMPLDLLVDAVTEAPAEIREAAGTLRHTSVYMVGVGYRAPLGDVKSWMYFPQPEVPFYRVTNFAKYSASHVPDADTGRYSSFMTETAYSPQLPIPRTGLEERVEKGLRSGGVVTGRPPVASIHTEDIEYAYPLPTRGRDAALAVLQPWLMERDVLSRGRFGAWLYELGNMDHAVKMGTDAAATLLGEGDETLWGTLQRRR
jgi:UDP-galactopyranose mutase